LQGRFWDFHDKVFSFITSPSKKKLSKSELAQIPIDLGLDMAKYLKDIKNPDIKQIIRRDMQEGQIAGVTGTPSLYLNGLRVKQRSPQAIQNMIDKELQKLKK